MEEEITSFPKRQDESHSIGAYGYLSSLEMSPRLGAIAAYITHLESPSVLDVGCGTGDLASYISRETEYTGIDISVSAISNAMQRALPEKKQFLVADIHSYKSDINFSTVVWSGVGKGCAGKYNSAEEAWCKIITKMLAVLDDDGSLIIECIQEYKESISDICVRTLNMKLQCETQLSMVSEKTLEHSNRHIFLYK